MQNRLDIILETVDMILEGSKRKWSKEKRLQHARGTYRAASDRAGRSSAARKIYHTRQEDDLGQRGHPVNLRRFAARARLSDMPGTGEEISGRNTESRSAHDGSSKAYKRIMRIYAQREL
jgi:hypothetical protein